MENLGRSSISDVARVAGVSKATVSHVINGTRFVEEETRQRVMDAIKSLGYRPNLLARSLTTKRTGIVGMLISDSSNMFFGEMLKGVESVLLAKKYGLIVCNTNETLEREAQYLEILLGLNVDGIIAAAASQQWNALYEASLLQTPVVYVDRKFEGMNGPFVGVDNVGGAYLGTRHLIECGHRAIGCLAGFGRLSSMRERVEGYQKALTESGHRNNPDWVIPSELSIEGGKTAMRKLFEQKDPPSAIFINNNLLALGALEEVKALGLSCPEDISIVAFDDHPWAAVSDPPLTVVRQPAAQLGRISAEILMKWVHGDKVEMKEVILLCELVLRGSC